MIRSKNGPRMDSCSSRFIPFAIGWLCKRLKALKFPRKLVSAVICEHNNYWESLKKKLDGKVLLSNHPWTCQEAQKNSLTFIREFISEITKSKVHASNSPPCKPNSLFVYQLKNMSWTFNLTIYDFSQTVYQTSGSTSLYFTSAHLFSRVLKIEGNIWQSYITT